MKSFASEAAARLASLRPTSQDILQGRALLGVYGRSVEVLDRFCREWSMDRAVADGLREHASYSNVPPFCIWLRERLDNPYLVPLSRLVIARRRYGVDTALDGFMLRWPQEVAWANLCRLVGSPEDTCLAHAWLKSARLDPGKGYLSLLDVISGISDMAYPTFASRDMPPAGICALAEMPAGFVPVWRRMTTREQEQGIQRQGQARVTAMAAKIRETAQRDERQRVGAASGMRMEADCPHTRISILAAAAELGLVSDELLAAFHALLETTRQGNLEGLPHRALAISLAHHIGKAAPLLPEEETLRREVVGALGPTWLKTIPADWSSIGDGKAANPSMASLWVAQIEQGLRRPPLDPMLDYGLWLAERCI